MKTFLKGSLLGKLIGTILAFLPFLNLIPTWFAVDLFGQKGITKILIFILFVIFWLPGLIVSLYWIWMTK